MGGVAAIRWLGHSSVQIDLDDTRILTDPALTARLGHLRRHHRVDMSTVATPDAIVISHVHLDHLHVPSLRRLGREIRIVVPAGAGQLLRRNGFPNVDETRVGDTFDVGRVMVETVPAVHPNRRGPHSRVVAEPVGYVLRTDDAAVYFAGDTDLFDTMADLAPIDVALLPIWGWGPSLGEGHLNPARAATAARRLQARVVVPVHWGTYSPISVKRPVWLDAPAAQFADELRAVDMIDALHVLAPGESVVVSSSSTEAPLELELVADGYAFGADGRDRWLDESGSIDAVADQPAKVQSPALVEAEGAPVVVRRDQPDP